MDARNAPAPTLWANDGQAESGATAGGRIQLALGLLAMVLAVTLLVMGALNRSLQAQVAAGQAKIAGAQTASNVNNTLIRLLAKSAADDGDPQLRALLARNGITFAPAAAANTPDEAGQ